MALDEWEMAGHLAAALGFGAAIGLERQWRARMAGLRTNALVAGGAALFVLLSQYGFMGTVSEVQYDGSRVAAQIVSGIGFLGAGVIMRDGLSVRGLNTAATLWCSAAVGCLAGTGMFVLAAFGTVGVVGANLLLRPLGGAWTGSRAVGRRWPPTSTSRPCAWRRKRPTSAAAWSTPWPGRATSCVRSAARTARCRVG